jgi:hypothetical protein
MRWLTGPTSMLTLLLSFMAMNSPLNLWEVVGQPVKP